MKKLLVVLTFVSVFTNTINCQSGFLSNLPVDVKEAYQKGTRSLSGAPGPNYWQNNSKYFLNAKLHLEKSLLTGEAKIVYFNNSPDSLKNIVLRLYQDLYKKGNPRDWAVNSEDLHDGTLISDLKINNNPIDIHNAEIAQRTATNLIITLPSSLIPGDSLLIECAWEFQIPANRQVRMGNYGNNNFFIAYWYPQVAVYDDIDGWDLNEYTGTVEFYNDFNDYDVFITTYGNQLVWASGELQNPEELFSKKTFDKFEKAKKSDEILRIVSVEENMKNEVLKNNSMNTWHFSARHIPDFSFAAASESNWEGSAMIADKQTGRIVFIDAVFPDSVLTFDKVALYARNSIQYMIDELPGWPFPYPEMTVFCNASRRGGMESPMMCNNGDALDSWDEDNLTFHEILHTYFPFYMGTNERKYAWMDEGWAAYLVSGYNELYSPSYKYLERYVKSFEDFNGKEAEVPLIYLSSEIKNYQAYRVHAYARSFMAYAFLHNALGDSIFKKSLHNFMANWNGKHPIPYDFFSSVQNTSKQQLDWFFIPWFFERSYADLGIKKVTTDNKIVLENIGGLPLPVVLQCEFEDGSNETYSENINIWSSGNQAIILQANPDKKLKKVKLGSELIPDIFKSNNIITIE